MNTKELIEDITKNTKLIVRSGIPLASYTTWKIGGPAEMLVTVKSKDELIILIQYCLKISLPFTILGRGSNVLISDKGLRGLVIINKYNEINITDNKFNLKSRPQNKPNPRVNIEEYSSIDYSEDNLDKVEVKIASGTILSYVINSLISQGITGLQWFAGIPGTIGGALFNNIHGGTHFFSEFVLSSLVLDNKGNLVELTNEKMEFDYDKSIFHTNKYVIIEVKLLLNIGDSKKALETSQAWARKKVETQPFNSGGCCFQNITDLEKAQHNLISTSWGYIIDNLLHLKGTRVGDAMISNRHGAFIENIGSAKASDVLSIMNIIYTKSKEILGITPKVEIIFLGFEKKNIEKFQ